MDFKDTKVDYENQRFDELDINPYETVIAVSRLARKINDKAQKYLGPEMSIKPVNIAIRKLESKDLSFVYIDEEKDIAERIKADTKKAPKKTTGK